MTNKDRSPSLHILTERELKEGGGGEGLEIIDGQSASDRGSLQHYRALKGYKANFHCDAINKSLQPAAVHR